MPLSGRYFLIEQLHCLKMSRNTHRVRICSLVSSSSALNLKKKNQAKFIFVNLGAGVGGRAGFKFPPLFIFHLMRLDQWLKKIREPEICEWSP